MKNFLQKLNTLPLFELVLLLSGILLIVFPETLLSVMLRVVGALIVLYAVYRGIALFTLYTHDAGFVLLFIAELLLFLVGIVFLANPLGALGFLATVAGIYLLIDGGIRLYRAVTSHRKSVASIVSAAISLAFGIALLIYPASVARVTAILCGVALIIEAIERLLILALTRAARKEERERSRKNGRIEVSDFEDKSNEL